ncbi:MAG: DegV family protein [Brotaphodocola sp.]
MGNYVISCCSTVDLTREQLEKRDIKYIYFHYELDGRHYDDDLWETMSSDAFYHAMEEGADTKTSQVNAGEFEEYFERFLKEGKDIIHVTLASGISGVLNSALIAKDILEERYPERKIYVIDSLTASSGYGLLMDKMADLRDAGMSVEELASWTEANKLKVQTWFFVTDLKYLVRGGRVSKVAGFVGNVLNICPVLNIDEEGKLIPRQKIRGKKKAIETLVNQMELFAEGGLDYVEKAYVVQSACPEDAQKVAELVKARFPKAKIGIYSIGPTIGSHTGPGTVGLFFWGNRGPC